MFTKPSNCVRSQQPVSSEAPLVNRKCKPFSISFKTALVASGRVRESDKQHIPLGPPGATLEPYGIRLHVSAMAHNHQLQMRACQVVITRSVFIPGALIGGRPRLPPKIPLHFAVVRVVSPETRSFNEGTSSCFLSTTPKINKLAEIVVECEIADCRRVVMTQPGPFSIDPAALRKRRE